MAYYTALIAAWNSTTQPPSGVIGTALTGLTTAQKLAAVNAWTVSNVPASTWWASSQQLYECIVGSELLTLTQANRMELWAFLNTPFPKIGGATAPSILIVSTGFFPKATCPLTYANLVALANTVAGTSLWWQANGYTSPIDAGDLQAAGGLS